MISHQLSFAISYRQRPDTLGATLGTASDANSNPLATQLPLNASFANTFNMVVNL